VGKGDWRRPSREADDVVSKSWCDTFGHRWVAEGEWCRSCGVTRRELDDEQRAK